jgi:RNase P/RNase MRP subunit POP5
MQRAKKESEVEKELRKKYYSLFGRVKVARNGLEI